MGNTALSPCYHCPPCHLLYLYLSTKSIYFNSTSTNVNLGRRCLIVTGCPLLFLRLHYQRGDCLSETPFWRAHLLRIVLLLPRRGSRLCYQIRRDTSDVISFEDMTKPNTIKWLLWKKETEWWAKLHFLAWRNAYVWWGIPTEHGHGRKQSSGATGLGAQMVVCLVLFKWLDWLMIDI